MGLRSQANRAGELGGLALIAASVFLGCTSTDGAPRERAIQAAIDEVRELARTAPGSAYDEGSSPPACTSDGPPGGWSHVALGPRDPRPAAVIDDVAKEAEERGWERVPDDGSGGVALERDLDGEPFTLRVGPHQRPQRSPGVVISVRLDAACP